MENMSLEKCIVNCVLPVTREPFEGDCYRLTVKGLKGGTVSENLRDHHVNALVLLSRLLYKTQTRQDEMRIVSMETNCTAMDIPDSASAVIVHSGPRTVEYFSEYMKNIFSDEWIECEPGLDVACEKIELPQNPLSKESSWALLGILLMSPSGPQALDNGNDPQPWIFSSPSTACTACEQIKLQYYVFGTVPSQKRLARARIRFMLHTFGGDAKFEDL